MIDLPGSAPSGRYGRPPMPAATRRRIVLALAGLTVLLGLVVAAVGYQRLEGVDVKGETAAFEAVGDDALSVTITVTRKDPSTPVVCIVRSKDRDGAETGRREILVQPSRDRTIQVTTTVKSYARPFAGDIYGCGTTVPPYLTAP